MRVTLKAAVQAIRTTRSEAPLRWLHTEPSPTSSAREHVAWPSSCQDKCAIPPSRHLGACMRKAAHIKASLRNNSGEIVGKSWTIQGFHNSHIMRLGGFSIPLNRNGSLYLF